MQWGRHILAACYKKQATHKEQTVAVTGGVAKAQALQGCLGRAPMQSICCCGKATSCFAGGGVYQPALGSAYPCFSIPAVLLAFYQDAVRPTHVALSDWLASCLAVWSCACSGLLMTNNWHLEAMTTRSSCGRYAACKPQLRLLQESFETHSLGHMQCAPSSSCVALTAAAVTLLHCHTCATICRH